MSGLGRVRIAAGLDLDVSAVVVEQRDGGGNVAVTVAWPDRMKHFVRVERDGTWPDHVLEKMRQWRAEARR